MTDALPETFSQYERDCLLTGKGIGETVILRLEQAGIYSFEMLSFCSAETLCQKIATALASSCWRNSPQARSAIAHAIIIARRETGRDFPDGL